MQNNKYTYIQNIIIGGLGSTLRILDKADAFIKEGKSTEQDLLNSTLISDMFNFTKQIQTISDSAKSAMAKLSGTEAPAMPDTETSIAQLKERIAQTLAYVQTFNAESFEGAADVKVKFNWMPGKYIESEDFVNTFVIQNIMFHIVTAYDILRMKGVQIGKMDFIGNFPMHDEA